MKKLLLPFFLPVVLFPAFWLSCGQDQPADKTAASADKTAGATVALDTFSVFPPEIEGCACYFSNNEEEFANGAYVYADDYEKTAFVRINGAMTKFALSKMDTFRGKRTVLIFNNDQFEITIDRQQVSTLEETWQQKGILTLKSKSGGQTITKNFYGECGC